MNKKIQSRQRRARKTRSHLDNLRATRITVDRSNRNIRAQLISVDDNNQHAVIKSASSLEASIATQSLNKTEQAQQVGKLLAERAIEAGITAVAFDRNGRRFHGRVKALADAARESGLKF